MTKIKTYSIICEYLKKIKSKKMFKDVRAPKIDEMFRFAATVVVIVFLIVTVAISYEINQLIS